MTQLVDLHDLPDEEARIIREFIEFLRERTKKSAKKTKRKKEITFASWPIGVKGDLRRSEIYDNL